jgi:thiol-disulfide isomerase/thioredoxin
VGCFILHSAFCILRFAFIIGDSNYIPPMRFPTALAATLALALFTACGTKISGDSPTVTLPTYDGETVTISPKDNKVTLVVFWATWCIPCIEEIPQLKYFQKTYADRGFRVISINIDDPEGHTAPTMAQQFELNYPVLVDDGTAEEAFGGLRALPTSFLVGRDGRLKHRLEGLYPQEKLESMIKAEL